MRKNIFRCGAAALLSAAIVLGSAMPAMALVSGPREPSERGMTEAELNDMTEEQWNRLMDNTLSYDEIGDLVHNFNPAIAGAWESFDETIRLMDTISTELRARRRDMTNLKESSKADKDWEDYANYVMQEIILGKSADALSKQVGSMDRSVTALNRTLRQYERKATIGAKQLMLAYSGLTEQRAIVADSLAMYEKLKHDAEQRYACGLATAADVQKAETERLKAVSQLSQLDAVIEPLRKNLILLLGWKEDAHPEIEAIPAADPSRIDAMDPEKDLTTAIAKNAELISFRHESHSHSTYSMDTRNTAEEAMNGNLLVNLKQLYQDCLAARTGFEGAKDGLAAAELTKQAADLQYQMGMLSTAQYLGAVTQYQSARTAFNTADQTLFQAMEAYDWALQGEGSVE